MTLTLDAPTQAAGERVFKEHDFIGSAVALDPRTGAVLAMVSAPTFDPDKFFDAWAKEEITPPYDNDFRKFIIRSFGLKLSDSFVYRAVAEVTLLQAQTYLEYGGMGRLHEWYKDEGGKQVYIFSVFSMSPLWRSHS